MASTGVVGIALARFLPLFENTARRLLTPAKGGNWAGPEQGSVGNLIKAWRRAVRPAGRTRRAEGALRDQGHVGGRGARSAIKVTAAGAGWVRSVTKVAPRRVVVLAPGGSRVPKWLAESCKGLCPK